MADWSEVRTGDTVRTSGKLWRVTKVARNGEVTVERNGKSHTGTPSGEVDIALRAVQSKAPEYAGDGDGETLLRKHLNATKTAEQDAPGEPWRVPPSFQGHADLRGHLYLMHGEYTDDIKGGGKTALAQLMECHETHHRDRNAGNPKPTNAWLDHIHDPEFKR